jgi:hypothetical protein
MIELTERKLVIQDTPVKAYLPTNGSGGIDLYAGEHIVAHIQGKVSGIVLVNRDTRWGILIDLPNNPSFNCVYADMICKGD